MSAVSREDILDLQQQIDKLRRIIEENDDAARDELDNVKDRLSDRIDDLECDVDILKDKVDDLESE